MRRGTRAAAVLAGALAAGLLAVCAGELSLGDRPCAPGAACLPGFRCRAGICVACVPERCNGEDDDCNGLADDGLYRQGDIRPLPFTSGFAPRSLWKGDELAQVRELGNGTAPALWVLGPDAQVRHGPIPIEIESFFGKVVATASGYAWSFTTPTGPRLFRYAPPRGPSEVPLPALGEEPLLMALGARGDELALLYQAAGGVRAVLANAADEVTGPFEAPDLDELTGDVLLLAPTSAGHLLVRSRCRSAAGKACPLEGHTSGKRTISTAVLGVKGTTAWRRVRSAPPSALPATTAAVLVPVGGGALLLFQEQTAPDAIAVLALALDGQGALLGDAYPVFEHGNGSTIFAAVGAGDEVALLFDHRRPTGFVNLLLRIDPRAQRAYPPIEVPEFGATIGFSAGGPFLVAGGSDEIVEVRCFDPDGGV